VKQKEESPVQALDSSFFLFPRKGENERGNSLKKYDFPSKIQEFQKQEK